MNYPLVIVKFRDVIQDSSWDGPDKVNCPTVTSVGWLVDSSDPVKVAGTLDDEGNPLCSYENPNCSCRRRSNMDSRHQIPELWNRLGFVLDLLLGFFGFD